MYPKSFEKLVNYFAKLPGVGNKTAIRYVFKLLESNQEDLDNFANSLRDLKRNVKRCECCGFLSENNKCDFCLDSKRDKSCICVVTNDADVVALEKTTMYKGLYHVLHGNISASKGIMPQDLNIDSLLKRINDETKEIVLAISPTVDGEMTAMYLGKLLSKYPLKVTRIAHGLPMGANLDYADELTIIKALANRRDLN